MNDLSRAAFESSFQDESRAYDHGHREAIVAALNDLAVRAQRQVVRTRYTAARACAMDVDRHRHQQDRALARVLAFALQSARQDNTGALDMLDVVTANPHRTFRLVEIFVHQGGNA
jgi:hypothetical protein